MNDTENVIHSVPRSMVPRFYRLFLRPCRNVPQVLNVATLMLHTTAINTKSNNVASLIVQFQPRFFDRAIADALQNLPLTQYTFLSFHYHLTHTSAI